MAIEKKIVKTKRYISVKDVGANEKCPPQAKLIMDTIKAAGGDVEREELLTLLKRTPEEGGLKTNQTAERILGFYRPKLVTLGVLEEKTVDVEIEVEVPDAPAKVETPADGTQGAEPATGEATAAPKSKVKGAKGEHKAA